MRMEVKQLRFQRSEVISLLASIFTRSDEPNSCNNHAHEPRSHQPPDCTQSLHAL